MSVGAPPPYLPKPQHALELETIVSLFSSCAKDNPMAVKLANKIKEANGHIPDKKFISSLQKAIYLTRRQVPQYGERAAKCREYARLNPNCTIPFLLTDMHRPELDVTKFRELIPLLNALIVHAYRSYAKAKQPAAEGAESLARHLTKGHQDDPCRVCEIYTTLSAKIQRKQERYELMQKYVEYVLNWAECKLVRSRDKDIEPWVCVTGLIAGAVIGGYLGQVYLVPVTVDTIVGSMAGGAGVGMVTLNKIKRLMTEPKLLDRPRSGEPEPDWIVLSDRVRYRFETISSGYLGRLFGFSSFTLGEVEITFGRLDVVNCLFNLAEDWRVHGKSLFELRRHFLDRLNKKTLKPEDGIQILTTLKTAFIGRGMLHFKTKSFFGPSYSCFFDDILERCESKTNPIIVDSGSPEHSGFIFCASTPMSHTLEADLNKLHHRCQTSLQSLAAIQEGKYGFDPQTNTFYPAAHVLKRKANRQSIDTVIAGIKELGLEIVGTLRIASSQVEKNGKQFAVWNSRLPILQKEVKEALEGLQRLRKPYEQHSAKLKKLDAANAEFEKEVTSALKALEEKLARLKDSPPPSEPVKRPLNVVVPFDNNCSLEQLEFLASFWIDLDKEQKYLITKRAAFKEDAYQLVKSSPELPWSYAVTPRNNTMLHYHISPYDAGRGRGSAFKTIKLGFFLEQNEHIVKLTTGFDFDKLAGEHQTLFQMAKEEQGFLKRMQASPHPNVARTHEVCWHSKNGKILQLIYQSYAQQGDLYFAWNNVIQDDKKVEKILKGLIEGLCHLHALGIIVNDIKLTNIVLDKEGNPIYIDFNCSHNQGSSWAWGGTLPMTDLILLQAQCLERKALPAYPSRDIWSLGLIFYFLLFKTHSIPWWPANENFTSVADFEKIIQDKARLFQEPARSDFWKHACWEMLQHDPALRPSALMLRQRLFNQPLKR